MQPGAYSSRFKMFQKEVTEQVKKDYEDENAGLVARNHRLHVETNRRRKAYAQKKKTQAQREERRRQIILAKRRQMIQDATDKFQRLNRTTQQSQNDNQKDFNTGPKYTLDEALHAIMGHDRSSSASIQHDHDRAPSRRPLSVPADLQSDSRLELKSSRSLFEQQLSQHQQSLATQQQMALRDFSEAMIGRLLPNGAVKGDDRQQGTSTMTADSLESDKGVAGHQIRNSGQETFRIDRAADSNPLKSLNKPQEWHLHTTNAKNGVESTAAYRHPAGANFTQNGGFLPGKSDNTAARNADNHVANAGSTFNFAASYAKETNGQNKVSDYSGVYPGANGPAPPNAGSLQSKTVINGVSAETGSNPGGSVLSEPGSTGGLQLHRTINPPSPNVAIVQPNCHTNLFGTNMSQKPATELEDILTVDKNSTTNHLTLKAGMEPQPYGQNGEIVANGSGHDIVVGFVSEQAPKGGDPGRFIDINGFADRVSLMNKEAVFGMHPTGQSQGPVHALDSSSVKYDAKFADIISVSSKAADSDLKSLSTYPVKTNVPSTQAVQAKPPTGRWKLGETGKSGTRPPDVERRETRDWQTAEGGSRPDGIPLDTKPVAAVERGLRELDMRQTDDTKQQVVRMENSAQQGTSVAETKPQLGSDEVYVDETSSNSSASSIRPVSRIPVPVAAASGKVPKGILKRRPSSCISRPDSGQPQPAGLTRSASMSTMSVSLRDSLEVTKQHRRGEEGYKDQKSGKKSVRFAEVLCEEEPDRPDTVFDNPGQLSAEKVLFYPRPPLQERLTERPAVTRPMRPISAKVVSTTPEVDPSVKVPRVASAGVMRRGPFYNPAIPSDSNQPVTIAGRTSNQLPVNSVRNPPINGSNPSSTNGLHDTQPPSDKASRDISGISLDKTPTEEEINWLWEKVRSCLNRETSSTSTASNPNAVATARQMVQVSCTNFDGSSLSTKPPVVAGRINSTYVNNYMGSQYPARRRITMETLNAYAKRTNNSLLQQRKFSQPGTGDQVRPAPQTSAYVPVNGIAKPEVNTTTTRVNAINNHVSESMAAFLAAEELTRNVNLDDSLISNVMNAAERRARTINANPTIATVPSALSIEEDRLMKSIDRLNEKLSAFPGNQQHMNQPTMVTHAPKPPPTVANKNRLQPFSTRRFINYSGTVPRHYIQINGTPPVINSQFKRTT